MNRYFKILSFMAALFWVAAPLRADDPAKLALVVFKQGDASIVRGGKTIPAKVKDLIYEKDEIITGASGELSIQLSSGVLVKISSGSKLVIDGIARSNQNTDLAIRLENGTILGQASKDGKKLDMKIQSPTAIAGVRGTEFIIDANQEQTSVLVNEGVVNVSNSAGEVNVDVEPGNKVVSDGKELISSVLEAFEKQRFEIFERFNKEKQKSFDVVVDQVRRNKELMEQQKQNLP
mgnify:CR=1 FL=1